MNSPLTRSAIGCAIAYGALVVGPCIVGTGVAKADLLGIGGGGGGIDVLGVDLLGGAGKTKGATGGQARAGAVSTAPSTRSVVIRSKADAQPVAETVPALPSFPRPGAGGGDGFSAGRGRSRRARRRRRAWTSAVSFAGLPPLPAAPAILPPAPRALPVNPSTSAPGPGRRLRPLIRFDRRRRSPTPSGSVTRSTSGPRPTATFWRRRSRCSGYRGIHAYRRVCRLSPGQGPAEGAAGASTDEDPAVITLGCR